jgi:hypothetical protein
MFRFLKQDDKAIMGLTLTQLAVMIATAIILAGLSSILFDSTWQQNQKMKQIAEHISSSLVSIDNAWFETHKDIYLSRDFQGYTITISSSTIEVSSVKSSSNMIRKSLLVHPLMRTCSDKWVTANQLHTYLYQYYGHHGTKEDPIPETSGVYPYLNNLTNNTFFNYSLQPYVIDKKTEITLDKVLIYIDENKNEMWEKTENILDYVLLYQCST